MSLSIKTYIKECRPIHLIGIGGVSMNSLAELLLSMNIPVTGSDRTESAVTDRLTALGAKITYAHLPQNVEGATLIVRTAAVHDDNPEIMRAHELGIPVMERAEAWGSIMEDYRNVVCLAGTHGKTTSTSMMTMVSLEAGLDPTVMVGSYLQAIDGTLRIGAKDYFVAESCEYCNSFHYFKPTIAVILNIEADHLDFFKDIDEIIASFHDFCNLVPQNGLIVANADDPYAMQASDIARKRVTFGVSPKADVYPENIRDDNGYFSFDVMIFGQLYANVSLCVPGKHNMLNALACCAVAFHLGISGTVAAQGLANFKGVSRRFELTGKMENGATVIDDYAHHPSEMRATLLAAKEMGFEHIICIFQPHTYTRTKALFQDFVEALRMVDQVILAPIYAAREKNTIGISSADIASQIETAVALASFEEISDYIQMHAGPNDLILTMGAGDIYRVGQLLVK